MFFLYILLQLSNSCYQTNNDHYLANLNIANIFSRTTFLVFFQMNYLSGEQIRTVLTYDKLITAMKDCLKAFSKGENDPQGAVQPLRSRISVKENNG